ncbi:MAG: hypothetical protein HN855_00895 [Anaerolineae bacterium]|nr:hypothetical protein [Anaerolineae bacterium]MBT7070816.1 hypothetical protein [Anaerolineae bacterium]MBT7323698.1 hypothetical protein [Anaerolineae bacterium]
MKRLLPLILLSSILLSACGALGAVAPEETTPTVSAEDIRATADAMVYDMLTQTQAAMPTNTPVPPTNTPLPPPTATITLIPTLADGEVPTVIATSAAAVVVPTTSASTSTFPCTEKPLLEWTGESVQLSITNNVKNSTANVFLCITTPYGEAGYINVPVVKSNSAQIPYGIISATAWVDGKKDFNATTGFEIKNPSSVQLVIEDGKLFFRAGCAPNC